MLEQQLHPLRMLSCLQHHFAVIIRMKFTGVLLLTLALTLSAIASPLPYPDPHPYGSGHYDRYGNGLGFGKGDLIGLGHRISYEGYGHGRFGHGRFGHGKYGLGGSGEFGEFRGYNHNWE